MKRLFPIAFLSIIVVGCGSPPNNEPKETNTSLQETTQQETSVNLETATFGAGCFWCVEAVFKMLDGVDSVASGYMGGEVDNPTYEQVCTGTTGHAEVIEIKFDPNKITFKELLEVFWKTHDPTTLNQQGNDRGTQYRSAVFYHNAEQKELAETYKKKLNQEKAFSSPIVTEITEVSEMYVAEQYHQDYFNLNKSNPYCNAVIPPKIDKMRKVFGDKLKKEAK